MNNYQKFAAKQAGLDADAVVKFQAWEAEQVELAKAEVVVETPVVEAKVTFATAELEGGGTIYAPGDDFGVGSIVQDTDENGEPVGAGEWTLPNGDVYVTDADSAITEITVADAPAEEEVDAQIEDDVADTGEISEELLAVLTDLDARVTALEGGSAELTTENESLKEELSSSKDLITKLSSVKPATPNVAHEAAADTSAKTVDYAFKTVGGQKLRGFKPKKQ